MNKKIDKLIEISGSRGIYLYKDNWIKLDYAFEHVPRLDQIYLMCKALENFEKSHTTDIPTDKARCTAG